MKPIALALVATCISVAAEAQTVAGGTRLGATETITYFDDRIAGRKTAVDLLDAEGWDYVDHHVCLGAEECGRTRKRGSGPVTATGKRIGPAPAPTQMMLVGHKEARGVRGFLVLDRPCDDRPGAASRLTVDVQRLGCFAGYTLLGRVLIENQYVGDTDGWLRIGRQTFQTRPQGRWETDFSIYLEDFSHGRTVISDGFTFGEHVIVTGPDDVVLHDERTETLAIPSSSSEPIPKTERCKAYADSRSAIAKLAGNVGEGVCQNMWKSGIVGWISGGTGSAGTKAGNHNAGFGISFAIPNPCDSLAPMYGTADDALNAILYEQCLTTPDPDTGDPDVNLDLSAWEEHETEIVETEDGEDPFANMGGNSCPDKTTTFAMIIDGEQCTVTETTECDADCNCETSEVIVCGGG